MILGFIDGVPACKSYDEESQEGCQAEGCGENCLLVRFLCVDCERYENCDYRYKPKILPSNRQALNDYALCQKFSVLPCSGGLMDQPHKVILQFQIIMDEMAKQEKIEREKPNKRN